MKQIIIIALFLPILSQGQLTDTTCIKTRWLALKPSSINKDIFLMDSTYNDSLDLVYTIKRLVESDKINIYNQNYSPGSNSDVSSWYYIEYNEELEKNMRDSISWRSNDPFFEIIVHSDSPLTTIYGEDSLYTYPDGTQAEVYPPPKAYVFPSRECDEIRIKEERKYNKTTNQYEFVPVGLSFYFKGGKYSRGHEKFWVDLNELFDSLNDKSRYPWYSAIVNKNYQGFQYMQVSCYDDEIKN